MNSVKNIVLVHGSFGDGSHWRKVIPPLAAKGYNVTAVQNSLSSLPDDIHRTRVLAAAQDGPTLLVGHSYGGAVITNAGLERNVVGLVYVAAFAPDEGESVGTLYSHGGNKLQLDAFTPDKDSFLWLKFDVFKETFCQDLSDSEALVLARTQKPSHARTLDDPSGTPAWRMKPAWYQISNNDHTIPPDVQRWMAMRIQPKKTIELDSSHVSMLSHPDEIVALIDEAAKSFEHSRDIGSERSL